MIETPQKPALWSRRQLIRSAGVQLLAAPALILTAQRAALSAPLSRQPLCPEVTCGYRYNPSLGEPHRGIAPGTLFEELPEDWICPVCHTAHRHW